LIFFRLWLLSTTTDRILVIDEARAPLDVKRCQIVRHHTHQPEQRGRMAAAAEHESKRTEMEFWWCRVRTIHGKSL
jgi:hypothetical protein